MNATMAEPWYAKYQVDVSEGESGAWKVERFTISETEAMFSRIRAAANPRREAGREVEAGEYTKLTRNGKIVMSDTPAEILDHLPFIRRARGRVLIHGLGLGMVLKAILSSERVAHVDVVEKSADVIALVAPTYTSDSRVHIHHGDAFTFQFPAGTRWDCVWNDVWDDICSDNLPEMHRLHRRYGRRADFVGSWARELVER